MKQTLAFYELAHYGKSSILFLNSILLVLKKLSFWDKKWGLIYNSMTF